MTDTRKLLLKAADIAALVCLVMGQRLAQDVSDYPKARKRLYRNSGNWDLVDLDAIEKPK